MIPVWDTLIPVLLEQGLSGIAIIGLAFMVWRLYQDNRAKDEEHKKLILTFQEALQAVQSARVDDANKTIDRIVEVSRSIDKSTEAIHDAIEVFRERR